jgi:site-specific DNA-methyltransferase (adenine-specific)
MSATQFMPFFDIYLRKKLNILSRIVWYYDSSGVQAKKYYGSMYEPILYCVKDKNNYTFNANDILVEAKTGAKRKLIDYRKAVPSVYNSEKVPGNVWEYTRVRYKMQEYENHPTQKPIVLLERIIKASSNKGDLIMDPFSGTFTTSFVAKELGRNSIGVELQDEYVKIGLKRLGL